MECQLKMTHCSVVTQALKKVPEVNASWHTDYIRQYHNVDVSVAVQTPAGLMVPVVRGADNLGLKGISSTVKALATKVRARVRNVLFGQF